MSIDAVALLQVSAARARKSAPNPARVQRLGPGACGVSLFEKYFGLEVRRAHAAVLLHHALGNALSLHRDPRGVLLFPDAGVPDLPASYDRLVELLAPAGLWIERAALARSDDELERIDGDEEDAGGFIERIGGLVERDRRVRGAPVISADLHNTRPSAEDISRLCGIGTLRALDLRHVVTLTRSGLAELGKLHRLERLILDELKITDDDLEILAALPRLSSLSVVRTRIQGAGFAALAELPCLEELVIGYTPLDDAGLHIIAKLPHLTALRLAPSNVTDVGVAAAARHPTLRVLDASRTRITDAVVPALLHAASLRTVILRGTALSAGALERLRHRSDLEVIG